MSQPFTRRSRTAYYLAWLPMSALTAVVLNLRGHPLWEAAALTVPLCGLYALVCGSSYYMARAMPLRRTTVLQVLVSLVGATAVASLLWVSVAYGAAVLLPAPTGPRLATQLWLLFGMGAAYFVLSLVYHYLILALEETRRAERTADEAKVLTREAELRALRAQVNPHFLFNSLNSIAALTTMDPEQARRMCQLLSDFLRASLRMGDLRSVSLKQELDLIRNYLEIEQVRFQDRMTVEQRVDDDCLRSAVPPLLLQPLVENAVKHGIGNVEAGGVIGLEVAGNEDHVTIAVENPIDPDRPTRPGSRRGLTIVQERLKTFYGDEARMMIKREDARFRVELRIPMRRAGSQ